MSKIKIHRYSCGFFNTDKKRKCALIHVEREGFSGFADLAPWPSLGDPSLEDLFFSTHPLWKRALFWSAFPQACWQCPVIASHVLFPSVEMAASAIKNGFEGACKIKIRNRVEEVEKLWELRSFLQKKQLRLDFNEMHTYSTFSSIASLLQELSPFIEYIEDPFPYEKKLWEEFSCKVRICFAKDHEIESILGHTRAAPFLIIKPAKHSWSLIKKAAKKRHRLIFSSYLGHPLEQKQALWLTHQFQTQARSFEKVHGLQDPALLLTYDTPTVSLNVEKWTTLSWEKLC